MVNFTSVNVCQENCIENSMIVFSNVMKFKQLWIIITDNIYKVVT